MMFETQGATE